MNCPAITQCSVPNSPGIGYVTETPETDPATGKGYGPANPIPLGYIFENTKCLVIASSSTKQEADALAYQQSVQCVQSETVSPSGMVSSPPLDLPAEQSEIIAFDWDKVPPIV